MTVMAVAQSKAPLAPDRAALRAELEATRAEVQRWLSALTAEQWRQKTPASAWTVAEVFEHLTSALEYLPAEVAAAKQGRGLFNYPKRLADPVSYWSTRWSARRATPHMLARRYAAAMDAALRALEDVQPGEWTLGADFYGEGHYSVAALFHTPAQHLAEHTAGLAASLAPAGGPRLTPAVASHPGLGLVALFALLSWLGEYVHNLQELPQLTLLSPENSLVLLTTVVFVGVWALRPLRRVGTLLLFGWAALHLIGGGVVSVLPLPMLPYVPAQTLSHYAAHLLYGLAQLPLLGLMFQALRAQPAARRSVSPAADGRR